MRAPSLEHPLLLFWCDVQNMFAYFLLAPSPLLSGLSSVYVAPLLSIEIFLKKSLQGLILRVHVTQTAQPLLSFTRQTPVITHF